MKNEISTIPISPEGLASDSCAVCPTTKQADGDSPLRALKLSDKQKRFIGNLQDGNKLLCQYKRRFKLTIKILQDFVLESDGGRIPTEISTSKLRKTVFDKKRVQPHMINDCMKFLKEKNSFLVTEIPHRYSSADGHKANPVAANATFYVGGQDLKELLDYESNKDRPTKTPLSRSDYRKKDHLLRGFRWDDTTVCQCCDKEQRLIEYNIRQEDNTLQPVCQSCYREDKDQATRAARAFYVRGQALEIIPKKSVEVEKQVTEEELVKSEAQAEADLEEVLEGLGL